MQKPVNTYTIQVLSDPSSTIAAQFLFYNAGIFAGRIDFYKNTTPVPASYLWHPTQIVDSQTYIVLAMSIDRFDGVCSIVRNEGPWAMELWPGTSPMVGATTPGYGGKIFTTTNEPVGEEERSFQSAVIAH